MKYLVQRPHPDELLSSVWIRTRRRAGVGIGLVTKIITGRKFAPTFLSYGHVVDLAHVLRVEPVDLLWQHSIFPYATAFVEPKVFAASLASALSTGHAAVGCGATVQSVSDHVHFRRFCPLCAQEDLRTCGESYWRREHHLPGVLACIKHLTALRQTNTRVNQIRPWPDVLPHEVRESRQLRAGGDIFALEFAKRSCALLHRTEVASMPRPPTWYRGRLIELGLLSTRHAVERKRLVQWAVTALGRNLARLGLKASDEGCRWLGLMVRPRNDAPVVPLKHVIFETLLETTGRQRKAILDFVPKGLSARPTEPADRWYAKALRSVLQGYRKRKEQVRVCDAMTEAGCWSVYRHARERFPRLRALVAKLRSSEISARRTQPA